MIDKDLKKIARTILRSAGQKEPPTDLARVLAYLRLHHERPWHLSQDVWQGLGRPTRGRTRFKSQERAPGARDRWKLAHEIAHHVLHGAVPQLRAGSWETHELEYEADLLAAELLIPDPWLQRAVKKADRENHPLDLEELAREFKVGKHEMEKRLRQLDLLRGEVLGRM
ncbi:MAG: ImmA/IrrE family metallo-endopeptidase [Actinomycetota bacterium]